MQLADGGCGEWQVDRGCKGAKHVCLSDRSVFDSISLVQNKRNNIMRMNSFSRNGQRERDHHRGVHTLRPSTTRYETEGFITGNGCAPSLEVDTVSHQYYGQSLSDVNRSVRTRWDGRQVMALIVPNRMRNRFEFLLSQNIDTLLISCWSLFDFRALDHSVRDSERKEGCLVGESLRSKERDAVTVLLLKLANQKCPDLESSIEQKSSFCIVMRKTFVI